MRQCFSKKSRATSDDKAKFGMKMHGAMRVKGTRNMKTAAKKPFSRRTNGKKNAAIFSRRELRSEPRDARESFHAYEIRIVRLSAAANADVGVGKRVDYHILKALRVLFVDPVAVENDHGADLFGV